MQGMVYLYTLISLIKLRANEQELIEFQICDGGTLWLRLKTFNDIPFWFLYVLNQLNLCTQGTVA